MQVSEGSSNETVLKPPHHVGLKRAEHWFAAVLHYKAMIGSSGSPLQYESAWCHAVPPAAASGSASHMGALAMQPMAISVARSKCGLEHPHHFNAQLLHGTTTYGCMCR